MQGLTGGALKAGLHERIKGHTVIPYVNVLDPLRVLYEDPADSHNILLYYSLTSVSKGSASWNREHLWPRSRGDSDQAGPDDSDLFHVVPADISVNNVRGSLYFDESNPSDPGYVIPAAPLAPQTSRDSDSWQPAPSERGDIARALFYMEVRYDGSEPNTTDMELVSFPPTGSQMANLNTLLLWNDQDPPDDAERRRNDLIFTDYQHNRNPFIDHPEWVTSIWGSGSANGTGTPIAQITSLSASATEVPLSSASLQVALNQFAGANGVTVKFSVSGTATAADYSIGGQGVTYDPASGIGTCLIPANFSSTVLSIVPVADGMAEPAETVIVTIVAGRGYTVVPGASATVTISDGPAFPVFWNFDSGTFPDPLPANSGFGSLSFAQWGGTITAFGGTSGNALALVAGTGGNNTSIDFRLSMQGFTGLKISFYTRGTTTGFDTGRWSYSTDGATFTELANVNTATRSTTFILRQVDFSAVAELDNAPNVTLRYTLSGATGTAGNNRIDDFNVTATAASTGNQLRTVQVAASDATASENGDPGVFAVRINGIANPGGLLVGFDLGGTATPPGLAGADYDIDGANSFDPALRRGTILIPEGAATALLRVLPIADTFAEGTETVVFTVRSQPNDYIVGANASAIINIAEPAANDLFVNATSIASGGGSVTSNNAEATAENGEPNHAGYAASKSLWWRWTAPSSGSVTISTAGSSFDTVLGVYTGSAVDALTPIASDNNSTSAVTSAVRFATSAGATYYIAVDGFASANGNISLAVTPSANPPVRPANDNFANSILLVGDTPSTIASNDYATLEPGEPTHAATLGGKSVWWRWTAINSGATTISTSGSNFDTSLGVYTGSSVGALSLIASNNNFGTSITSRVTFNAVAGQTYQIAVAGNLSFSGTARLAVTGFALPPPNDNFVNAITLSGALPATSGTNVGATKEPGEPNHAGFAGGTSVWWRWTAPADATMTLSTAGSDYDTMLGVYVGGAVNALTLIAGDDDGGPGNTSQVVFNAVVGTTYQIAVDGFGAASGNITLAFLAPTGPIVNDNFADATLLTGAAPSATGSNVGASKEPGEPNHAGDSGGRSVWWSWTASQTGYASVATGGSNFDTLLAVYTGGTVNALTTIASNDQSNGNNQSQLVFSALAGTTYYLAVDGFQGAQGNVALFINGTLPLTRATLTTSDASAAERPLDTGSFYITLRDPQPQPVSVNVTLAGTATAGIDYTPNVPLNGNTATVTISPGQTLRFVTVTPVPDQEFTEFDETILCTIAAGSGYTVGSGAVVPIILHDDTPYAADWAQQFGPAFSGPAAAPLADFNGNGVANLLEFAFNGNPITATLVDSAGNPLLPVLGFGDYPDPADGNIIKRYPTITFNRRTDSPQLSYGVENSTGLASGIWNTNAAVFISASTVGMPAGVERVTYRSPSPATGAVSAPTQFFRLRVTAP